MTPAGFPHSDTPGSQLGCQLPRAYRRLQRPSSALDAKASTVCPLQLVNTNTQQKQQRHTLQKQTHNNAHHSPETLPLTGKNLGDVCGHHVDARVHYQSFKHQENTRPNTPQRRAGLISQGPTVCQLLHPRAPPRFPHPQTSCGSYSGMPHADFDVHR